MLVIWQILSYKSYKLICHQSQKVTEIFIYLYCLSSTNHIVIISVCKYFVIKFIVNLAFFSSKKLKNNKITTNFTQKLMWYRMRLVPL